ncbi:MAG: NB-ARC domain-containing protein, partial [Actinomycetota bacterium]|nr:NB-ARC domain-containing protein [Actinomycetota bacterium]
MTERALQASDGRARAATVNPSVDVRGHRLATPDTRLFGRKREKARVVRLLADHPVVTISGVTGIGKTRLVTEVVAAVGDGFDEGVWIVNLTSVDEDDLVAETVAAALGLSGSGGQPAHDAIATGVGGRRLLLVLDGCDDVESAASSLVGHLVRACPELRVLAASINPLAIDGQRGCRLGPLASPAPDVRSTSRIATFDAVKLFVERATDADPSFALTSRNARSVAALCRAVDG